VFDMNANAAIIKTDAVTFNPWTTSTSYMTLGATTGSINQDTFTLKNNAGTTTYLTANSSGVSTQQLSSRFNTPISYGTTTGTIAPDAATGYLQKFTTTGNITWNAFTNPLAGQAIRLHIKQGGSHTLTTNMTLTGGSASPYTIAASPAGVILDVYYDGTTYFMTITTVGNMP
jgi:hypothetical protein